MKCQLCYSKSTVKKQEQNTELLNTKCEATEQACVMGSRSCLVPEFPVFMLCQHHVTCDTPNKRPEVWLYFSGWKDLLPEE